VRRYLVISLIFHVGVALGSTLFSPLGSFSARDKRPSVVINVGLVDLGDKTKARAGASAPKPVEAVKDPLPKAQPEKVAEPEKKKPVAEKKIEPAKDKKNADKESTDDKKSKVIAAKDSISPATGTITEGSGEADVWGVEVGPEVNPYHRRGFAAIRSNWRNPAVGPAPLKCIVRFTVNRAGELAHIELEKPSGSELFDRAALRAVQVTKSWDRLPRFWEDDEQLIHLEFEYRP
jgi:TonB family protein